jgi:hypothetical protein
MGWSKTDQAALLETTTLELIRTQGIFLIGSVALYQFTSQGKTFSIIFLLISLAINTILLGYYYAERSKITRLGQAPRTFVDLIVIIMFFVFFLTIWIIYEVAQTEPAASLVKLAEEIEQRIDVANERQIEENRKIVQDLGKLSPNVFQRKAPIPPILNLEALNRNKNVANNAAIASIS